MDPATLRELVGFLLDPKAEVRVVAASHLLTVTGSDDGLAALCADDALLGEVADSLARALAGSHELSKIALSVLINVSDREPVVSRLRARVGTVVALVTDPDSPGDVVELAAMLLANLTRDAATVVKLLETESEFKGRRFLALVGKLLATKEDEGGRDAVGWLALVLQNCSQDAEARRLLLDRQRPLMQHMVTALGQVKSVRRRRGIIAALRNCLMETAQHAWLVEPPLSLAHVVLGLLVNGKGDFSADEKRAMPVDVRELAFDASHQPEADDEARLLLVECVVALCYHAHVVAKLKAWSAYPIMRELERFEKHAGVTSAIYEAVELLLRDHANEPSKSDIVAASAASTAAAQGPSAAAMQTEILELTAEEQALAQCAVCKLGVPRVAALQRCTGCFSVSYCGRAHQTQHWAAHKELCLEKQKKMQAMVDAMNARAGFKTK